MGRYAARMGKHAARMGKHAARMGKHAARMGKFNSAERSISFELQAFCSELIRK